MRCKRRSASLTAQALWLRRDLLKMQYSLPDERERWDESPPSRNFTDASETEEADFRQRQNIAWQWRSFVTELFTMPTNSNTAPQNLYT
jgi:hypothetical protein